MEQCALRSSNKSLYIKIFKFLVKNDKLDVFVSLNVKKMMY
jgi:hypothetical protein